MTDDLAARMAAVGRLAAGIAHDVNNILTIVNGHADLLLADLPDDSPLRADVEEIRRAGARGVALARQLQRLGGRPSREGRDVEPDELIAGLAPTLAQLLGDRPRVDMDLRARGARIRVDPERLELALVELATQARDATADGGRLRIGTEVAAATREVVVCVADEGPGMDAETVAHVFEPFFAPRVAGRGTDLGLAIACSTVVQSGGSLEVESSPDAGTTVRARFPAASTTP